MYLCTYAPCQAHIHHHGGNHKAVLRPILHSYMSLPGTYRYMRQVTAQLTGITKQCCGPLPLLPFFNQLLLPPPSLHCPVDFDPFHSHPWKGSKSPARPSLPLPNCPKDAALVGARTNASKEPIALAPHLIQLQVLHNTYIVCS